MRKPLPKLLATILILFLWNVTLFAQSDECSGATEIAPAATCTSPSYAISTSSISASTGASSCIVTNNGDVWFKFVAVNNTAEIQLNNIFTTDADCHDMYVDMDLYSGSCGSLSSVDCDFVNWHYTMLLIGSITLNPTSLMIGATYYVRVTLDDAYNLGGGTFVPDDLNFEFCVISTPSATIPANDNANGAVSLTVGAGCGSSYSNIGATQNPTEPHGACAAPEGYKTVWFKFVAPTSGAVKISTDFSLPGTTNLDDTRIALFSAAVPTDYSTFTNIACDEDGGTQGDGLLSTLYATGLVAGQTYYIQVDGKTDENEGSFCITVDELDQTMISTTNTCASSFQTPYVPFWYPDPTYSGWVSYLDAQGKLIALVKKETGFDYDNLTPYQHIYSGSVRIDTDDLPILDRSFSFDYSGTKTNIDLQLFFLNSELSDLESTISEITSIKVASTSCIESPSGAYTPLTISNRGSSLDNQVKWIQVNTASFSSFFIKGSSPLPLVNIDLNAQAENNQNIIHWEMTSDNKYQKLELEKSVDGIYFTPIYATNNVVPTSKFIDLNITTPSSFYRLKLVDENNKILYSKIAHVENKNIAVSPIAYPNPTFDDITIEFDFSIESNGKIDIIDFQGKVVESKTGFEKGNKINLSLGQLPSGIYFIKYYDAKHTTNFKISKLQKN